MNFDTPMPAAPRASILIVEDEAVVALDLKGELEDIGYRVVGIADTAQKAVELARTHRPQLTLMDIMLKGGTDGIVAAETLHRELSLPVIFLTSFNDEDTVRRAARTAAYGYLTKPFQTKELRAGVEVALYKAGMERRLRDSDRWFALTLRCVQDGLIVVDPESRVRLMNPAAEALTGWSSAAATGQPVDEVVRFEDGDAGFEPAVQAAIGQNRVIGVRYARRLLGLRREPVFLDESAGPICDESGACLGAVLVLRDATGRLNLDAQLRASEARFRSAFEGAPLGMALTSMAGAFLQVNDALCRLLGCDSAWLLSRAQGDVTEPSDGSLERNQLAMLEVGSAAVVQFEKHYRRQPGGEPVHTLVNVSLLSNPDGAQCLLYQVHDLTDHDLAMARMQELAAERLQHEVSAQASRTRDEFISRMSHEMRTPLNAVLGFAQLLQMKESSGLLAPSGYSQPIVNAGRHLLSLVEDVLDVQRAANGSLRLDMADADLAAEVAPAVEMLLPMAREYQVQIAHEIATALPVHVDPLRLRQVVLNLGSNAIKYSLPGGRVTLGACLVAPDTVQLTVDDHGIGMSDEQLQHLFEPFNRLGREASKVPGVGLGLVITRKLVEQMGGSIAVARAATGGTRVTVQLQAGGRTSR